jgi:hypothetical protein
MKVDRLSSCVPLGEGRPNVKGLSEFAAALVMSHFAGDLRSEELLIAVLLIEASS